jgi:Xaa-Pro aminopeptidase
MPVHPIIPDSEFYQRKEASLAEMQQKGLDALIAFSGYQEREGHVCYLTNHHNSFPNGMSHTGLGYSAYLLFADGSSVLAAPFGCQAEKIINVDTAVPDTHLAGSIRTAVKSKLAGGWIGITGMDVIPAEYYLQLVKELSQIQFEPADDILENLRVIKSPAEIETLMEAARIGAVGLKAGMTAVKPGATQHDIEFAARKAAFDAGADFIARVRVSSGKSIETLTWPMTANKALDNGDFIFLDLIGWYANYGWDNSRVGIVGKPNTDQKGYLDLMVEATAWMIETMQPGKQMEFVHTEARGRMIVPMAHGIGLEILENPWLHLNKYFTLRPGMVLCVEPIVSSEPYGGMSIEDTVLVTETGLEVISPCERVFW